MIHYEGFGITLHHGDCIEVLRDLPDASVDAVVTDPPYGISFMEDWDSFGGKQQAGVRGGSGDKGVLPGYGRGGTSEDRFTFRQRASREFQQWCNLWTAECLRVLKPGGHMLAFGGTRTYHRLACAIEDAGFEIRDSIAWLQGQGFPKSLDVSKAIDKMANVDPTMEREIAQHLRDSREAAGLSRADVDKAVFAGSSRYAFVEGRDDPTGAGRIYLPTPDEWVSLKAVLGLDDRYDAYINAAIPERKDRARSDGGKAHQVGTVEGDFGYQPDGARWDGQRRLTAPRTSDAERWQGWGTALRPCHEPIVVARKPLEGTVAQNVLTYGTGALNIDATRIEHTTVGTGNLADNPHLRATINGGNGGNIIRSEEDRREVVPNPSGRWPSNVAVSHSPECEPTGVVTETVGGGASGSSGFAEGYGSGDGFVGRGVSVQMWRCAPGCQVAALDAQSGITKDGTAVRHNGVTGGPTTPFGAKPVGTPDIGYGGAGGASRYFKTVEQTLDELPIRAFYTAKASGAERPVVGESRHVTVKPLELMRWLVRMVCPPGGVVLDPFVGSGTTAEACVIEGFRCIAIEKEADYLPLTVSRVTRQRDPVAHVKLTQTADAEPTLFDLI